MAISACLTRPGLQYGLWATTWASRFGHCAGMDGAPLTRTPPRRSWGRGPPPPGWRRIQARRLTCLTASYAAPTGRVPGLRGAFIIASTPCSCVGVGGQHSGIVVLLKSSRQCGLYPGVEASAEVAVSYVEWPTRRFSDCVEPKRKNSSCYMLNCTPLQKQGEIRRYRNADQSHQTDHQLRPASACSSRLFRSAEEGPAAKVGVHFSLAPGTSGQEPINYNVTV